MSNLARVPTDLVVAPRAPLRHLDAPIEGADTPASKIARNIAVYLRVRESTETSDVMQRIEIAKMITELGPELQREAQQSRRAMLLRLGVTEIA